MLLKLRVPVATSWALALAVVFGGCASTGSSLPPAEDSDRPSIYGIEVLDDAAAQRSLTGAYAAAHDKVRSCLTDQGFEYHEPAPTFDVPGYTDEADQLSEDGYAERFGFGVAPVRLLDFADSNLSEEEGKALANERRAEVQAYEESLTAPERRAYEKALLGTESSSGCDRFYSEMVENDLQDFFNAVEDLDKAKRNYVLDTEVVDYFTSWSQCMKDAGYAFTSPLDAHLQYVDATDSASRALNLAELGLIADEEIAAAKASVACGRSTKDFYTPDLRDIWDSYGG